MFAIRYSLFAVRCSLFAVRFSLFAVRFFGKNSKNFRLLGITFYPKT